MAGVTQNGFVPKRMGEIVQSLKDNAKPIFQDLVPPTDEVDTSDTTTLGRLIGLIAKDLDEVWQALHDTYNQFDPNSAYGVGLDNIVQYIGLVRQQGAPTVLRTSVWGTTNTYLPEGQVIENRDGDRFSSITSLTFSTNDILGFAVVPSSVVEGQENGFTFITEEGVYTISHTASAGDTAEDVLQAWQEEYDDLDLARSTAHIEDGKMYVVAREYYAYITAPSLTNSSILEVKKRLTFNSEDEGDIPAPLDTVTKIATPVYGWLSVTNEISAEKGSVWESDVELRERFKISKAVRANNTSEALFSQLTELEDVIEVRIHENMTDGVDTLGLPAHSFMAIVRGGSDTNIGEIVWNNKPVGISSYGTDAVVVRDSQNIEQTVYFSRAVEVPIYVDVVVTKTDNTFPDSAVEQMRSAIVEYINSRGVLGEDVIYTRLFTPINSIPGHQVDSLTIGTSASPSGTANISMAYNEYPITFPEYVTITVTT